MSMWDFIFRIIRGLFWFIVFFTVIAVFSAIWWGKQTRQCEISTMNALCENNPSYDFCNTDFVD